MAVGPVFAIDVAMLGPFPAAFFRRFVKIGQWSLAFAAISSISSALATPLDDARDQLRRGKYEEVIATAESIKPASRAEAQTWTELAVRALLDVGRYTEAEERLATVGEIAAFDLPLRLLQRETSLDLGKSARSTLSVREVMQAMRSTAILRGSDYARSSEFQAVAGEASLLAGLDPRLALENFLKPAQQNRPASARAFLVSGRLALEKRDYDLAARTFRAGLEIAPEVPDLLCGLAASFRSGLLSNRSFSRRNFFSIK